MVCLDTDIAIDFLRNDNSPFAIVDRNTRCIGFLVVIGLAVFVLEFLRYSPSKKSLVSLNILLSKVSCFILQ